MTATDKKIDQLILERIMDIGSGMLKAGGEIKRVEETITLLCRAYGALDADVFVITSDIVTTVRFEDSDALTQTRRIKNLQVNMAEVEFYNQLSREICAEPMTNEEILSRLKQKPDFNTNQFLLSAVWAVISASFTLFFGGEVIDAVISFIIGGVLCLFYNIVSKRIDNNYCVVVLCSVFGGLLPFFLRLVNPEINSFYINIGNIMLLIPGVALMTSIRDMFSGDTISGLLEFFEAMLVGFVIAFGFAVMNSTYTINVLETSPLLEIATAFAGSLGFAVVFGCRYKIGFVGALGGALSWIIVVLLTAVNISEYIAFFVAAMAITLYSRLMAMVTRCPATPFLRVAVVPLVPGKALYMTMVYALSEEWQSLFTQGISTILYALCISSGILIISTLFDMRDKKIIGKLAVRD